MRQNINYFHKNIEGSPSTTATNLVNILADDKDIKIKI